MCVLDIHFGSYFSLHDTKDQMADNIIEPVLFFVKISEMKQKLSLSFSYWWLSLDDEFITLKVFSSCVLWLWLAKNKLKHHIAGLCDVWMAV